MTEKKSSTEIAFDSSDAPPARIETRIYEGQTFDTMLHAWLSKYIGWISPASFSLALYDWFIHTIMSPAKQIDLMRIAGHDIARFMLYAYQYHNLNSTEPVIETRSTDTRFKNEAWQQFPFNLYEQSFLMFEKWCDEATHNIRGASKHYLHVVNFAARQYLDMFSPSNFPWTNPEVIHQTNQSGGMNFIDGFNNYLEDLSLAINNHPPVGTENFVVGKNVAITPGKVIYRNHLIELIQYEPTTKEVYADPILIIPAWIMKYYILDLSPHNSLVKFLVEKGHTVFMISWRNPESEDRELTLDDYRNLGIISALNAIQHIIPGRHIHAVGYCLGGTLLMIAAAALAEKSNSPIKSITLFAAQIDFKEAGELSLFIDSSQITYLEDIMWEKGYLDGPQMAGAFSMLHSNDLVWSRMIRDYLMGKRRPINDLMAWDMDTTRLPYRMHSEYLHSLFLNNDLSQGRFKVGKRKIALPDIKLPIFAVATIKDHVSPWKSVYKIHLFTDTDITFVLTNGGHNAGIVSEPGHRNRAFQKASRKKGSKYINTEHWQEDTPITKGSWWPEWEKWLAHLSEKKVPPPTMGDKAKGYPILCDAPGTYVLQK